MPSKSKAQARLMAGAAHDAKFAKKAGVPRKVAREYNRADKGAKLPNRVTDAEGRTAVHKEHRKRREYA